MEKLKTEKNEHAEKEETFAQEMSTKTKYCDLYKKNLEDARKEITRLHGFFFFFFFFFFF